MKIRRVSIVGPKYVSEIEFFSEKQLGVFCVVFKVSRVLPKVCISVGASKWESPKDYKQIIFSQNWKGCSISLLVSCVAFQKASETQETYF